MEVFLILLVTGSQMIITNLGGGKRTCGCGQADMAKCEAKSGTAWAGSLRDQVRTRLKLTSRLRLSSVPASADLSISLRALNKCS
jgi:hypothetical protein